MTWYGWHGWWMGSNRDFDAACSGGCRHRRGRINARANAQRSGEPARTDANFEAGTAGR